MNTASIAFLELYKRVDCFIRDAYSSQEGVSEYLRQMEARPYSGKRLYASWDSYYKTLKHLRWVRNQLSHEVSFDSELCSESDYNWLAEFYQALNHADDPLAIVIQEEKKEQQSRAEMQHSRQSKPRNEQKFSSPQWNSQPLTLQWIL